MSLIFCFYLFVFNEFNFVDHVATCLTDTEVAGIEAKLANIILGGLDKWRTDKEKDANQDVIMCKVDVKNLSSVDISFGPTLYPLRSSCRIDAGVSVRRSSRVIDKCNV